jgi:hypothetical protein
LALLGGCQSLEQTDGEPSHWGHHTPAAPVSPALVDVGGMVKYPGALIIPPEGLNLLQAIIRAGGSTAESNSAYLIELRRGTGTAAANFHFSPEYVFSGLAGEIALQAHDLVQIASAVDSPLTTHKNFVSAARGDRYSVLGEVRSPGGRVLPDPTKRLTLNGVHRENIHNQTMVLTRASAQARGVNQYILSSNDFHKQQSVIGDTWVTDGDTFEFQPLNAVAIVATGVMRTATARLPGAVPAKHANVLARCNGPLAGPVRQLGRTTESLVQPLVPAALTPAPVPARVQIP